MIKEKIRQQFKNEALNKIISIYKSPNFEKGVGMRSNSWDDPWSEQRDDYVKDIISDLLKKLETLK